jgi:hypothetical protein
MAMYQKYYCIWQKRYYNVSEAGYHGIFMITFIIIIK